MACLEWITSPCVDPIQPKQNAMNPTGNATSSAVNWQVCLTFSLHVSAFSGYARDMVAITAEGVQRAIQRICKPMMLFCTKSGRRLSLTQSIDNLDAGVIAG